MTSFIQNAFLCNTVDLQEVLRDFRDFVSDNWVPQDAEDDEDRANLLRSLDEALPEKKGDTSSPNDARRLDQILAQSKFILENKCGPLSPEKRILLSQVDGQLEDRGVTPKDGMEFYSHKNLPELTAQLRSTLRVTRDSALAGTWRRHSLSANGERWRLKKSVESVVHGSLEDTHPDAQRLWFTALGASTERVRETLADLWNPRDAASKETKEYLLAQLDANIGVYRDFREKTDSRKMLLEPEEGITSAPAPA